jgi:fumarate reductase subunit C
MIILINESLLYEKKGYDFFRKMKIFKDISDEDMRKIYKADPSESKQNVQWLLLLYYTGKLLLEDLYKATEYLEVYERMKAKDKGARNESEKILKPEYRDLNRTIKKEVEYKDDYDGKIKRRFIKVPAIDLPMLARIIEPYDKKEVMDTPSAIKERTHIMSIDGWDIYKVDSYETSCILGSGTKWCTATGKTRKHYNERSEEGDLYIFIKGDKKYQLQIDKYDMDYELADKYDTYITMGKFLSYYPKLYDFVVKVYKGNLLSTILLDIYDFLKGERHDKKYLEKAAYWLKKKPFYPIYVGEEHKGIPFEFLYRGNLYSFSTVNHMIYNANEDKYTAFVDWINNHKEVMKLLNVKEISLAGYRAYTYNINDDKNIYLINYRILLSNNRDFGYNIFFSLRDDNSYDMNLRFTTLSNIENKKIAKVIKDIIDSGEIKISKLVQRSIDI